MVATGDIQRVRDSFGHGVRVVEHHGTLGGITVDQIFWLYEGQSEVFVQLKVLGNRGEVASRYLAPVVLDSELYFAHSAPLQSLFVPYDNDGYVRYRSDNWGTGKDDAEGSYEVGAVYDDSSRHGLVVGSIDHTEWKSAVKVSKGTDGNVSGLTAYAGVTSKLTRDSQPHGLVSGSAITSPRFSIGWYSDWRNGLERYGEISKTVQPPLPWTQPVPFGWSSWSGHKDHVQAKDGDAAINFFVKDLPAFRSGGTAYINLDSFWDNMTLAQRVDFVKKAHAAGLKAGIYYTPYTGWGRLTDRVNNSKYLYSDIVLKDEKGEPLPKIDGGYPLDPTHPGETARVDKQLDEFIQLGFDLVKLDFLTHGSVEGVHYDKKITTGTAAYAFGMRHIVDYVSAKRTGHPMFICLSIAPLFPNGVGQSRRISCDVFANIGATEYLLNSANYAWWQNNRIYRFNDPDSASVYQPLGEPSITEGESRCRLSASVIVGGMLIEGDNLSSPPAEERVRQVFRNKEVVDLARREAAYRPVYGDTVDKAGNTFISVDRGGKTAYLAIFNFEKKPVSRTVPISRLDLDDKATWKTHELWTGANGTVTGSVKVELGPMDCALIRLTR